jgi:hypothetical protein
MSAVIYDKTEKGREEVATRKYQLAPRMRSLLVMVDGKQSVNDLLKKIIGLGLNEHSIQELVDQELIVEISVSVATQVLVAAADNNDRPAEVRSQSNLPSVPIAMSAEEEARRFRDVYNFFNETVKSNLGLRGFTLQLKVERAGNIQDFIELRRQFIEAIFNSKGREVAIRLRDHLDQLLFAETTSARENVIPDDA